MITRTVKQIKMVEISRPPYYIDGGVGITGCWVDEKIYYRGFYTTAEDIQQRFEQAQKNWAEEKKEWWCTKEEVTIKEWWENVEQGVDKSINLWYNIFTKKEMRY